VFQTAACNATHTISQRVAKWLLASYARTELREFDMTQDELAVLLGVGRTFISRVVNRLRSTGVIGTKRGSFVIEDELALRTAACPCAAAIDQHFQSVLRGLYPA
jgi:CRP-like cAMP-binding protein